MDEGFGYSVGDFRVELQEIIPVLLIGINTLIERLNLVGKYEIIRCGNVIKLAENAGNAAENAAEGRRSDVGKGRKPESAAFLRKETAK